MNAAEEETRRSHVQTFGWEVVVDIWNRRWPIVAFTLVTAALAAGGSLLLPNQFTASARVLIPDQSNSLLSAFLGGSRASAARIFGGGVGGSVYARSIAILTSRSVGEAVVDSFALVRHYGIEPGPTALDDALSALAERSAFEVDNSYDFLNVSVRDESPRRAADMANYYVRLLNDRNAALATDNATSYRRFVEERYRRANLSLDSLLDAVRSFQQRSGVIDLESQAQAYFAQLGQMRAEQARLQVQLQALRSSYGPESPEVAGAEQALQEATRQYEQAANGQNNMLPVPRAQVPSMVREYANLERERVVQKSILEALTPMVEAARMEEMRKTETVQVVDVARAPQVKTSPKRSLIVLVSALSALLLAAVGAALRGQWLRQGDLVRVRLARAAEVSRA